MGQMMQGARYLLQGFALIQQKGIRHFAYLPIFINTLLFSIAIWFGFSHLDGWIDALLPSWLPNWVEQLLMWVIWPLFLLLVSIIVFFTFSLIANIISAPFNGLLAEVVEKKLSGETPPEVALSELVRQAPAMIWNEFKKLAYMLIWVIPLLILSWIPIINLASPLMWLWFSSWMLAIDYHDYPMGNHQLLFKQQRPFLKRHRSKAIGFGLATTVATMIPVVNFFVIPAAVAGATALFVANIRPELQANKV
jgi:CysZ protein